VFVSIRVLSSAVDTSITVRFVERSTSIREEESSEEEVNSALLITDSPNFIAKMSYSDKWENQYHKKAIKAEVQSDAADLAKAELTLDENSSFQYVQTCKSSPYKQGNGKVTIDMLSRSIPIQQSLGVGYLMKLLQLLQDQV